MEPTKDNEKGKTQERLKHKGLNNMKKISSEDFTKAVEYVKKAECHPFATLDATAKMLGVRKFDVMAYIEKNPKLVVCSSHDVRYAIDAEGVKKLETAGWTVVGKWQSKKEQE